MCSFLKCPSDISVILWLSVAAIIFTYVFFLKYKNKHLSFVILSVLLNVVFFLASISGSLIFRIYRIEWLQYLSVFVWPIINIMFIFFYVKKKNR